MKARELQLGNLVSIYGKETVVDAELLLNIEKNNDAGITTLGLMQIKLTEEWLILNTDVEQWGVVETNEFEKYTRIVFHNVVDGSSNYEVHFIKSTYGGKLHEDICYSVDDDERQHIEKTGSVHSLQNAFYMATGFDLAIKEKHIIAERGGHGL